MAYWRAEFEQKVREIDLYLRFLELVADIDTRVTRKGSSAARLRRIASDVPSILKAGAFLLLYNLVEASIRAGLIQISEAISIAGTTYRDAHSELRKLWVREHLLELERSLAGPVTYRTRAVEIVDMAVRGDTIRFSSNNFPIAGNLDARKVREIAEQYGFSHRTNRAAKGGEKLQLVKDLRNALAHGNISFAECGRDHIVSDIQEIKKEVVRFLRDIMKNIDDYVASARYRAA